MNNNNNNDDDDDDDDDNDDDDDHENQEGSLSYCDNQRGTGLNNHIIKKANQLFVKTRAGLFENR